MKEKKKFKISKIPKKTILAFIICAITFSMIGATASTLLYSKDVTYDNSSSGLSSTNLQDALDELYEQAKNAGGCPKGYKCTFLPEVVTSGDGLYVDTVESGRYFYRGTNVDNYIIFNNETWRIISVESDGTIKIIRNEQISSTFAWDEAGTRDSSTSTYCANASNKGCNSWAATANLVNTPSNFIQYYPNGGTSGTPYSGTVTQVASLNTYLNGTYYNSLSSAAKVKVAKGTFNVSTPGYYTDTETLEIDAQQEKQYQWQGKVALMTVTELLRASTSSSCTSLNAGTSSGNCNTNNWLWPTFNTSSYEWTLSPYVYFSCYDVWNVNFDGYVGNVYANATRGVRPVVFLSSSITLSGSGTQSDPYTLS